MPSARGGATASSGIPLSVPELQDNVEVLDARIDAVTSNNYHRDLQSAKLEQGQLDLRNEMVELKTAAQLLHWDPGDCPPARPAQPSCSRIIRRVLRSLCRRARGCMSLGCT